MLWQIIKSMEYSLCFQRVIVLLRNNSKTGKVWMLMSSDLLSFCFETVIFKFVCKKKISLVGRESWHPAYFWYPLWKTLTFSSKVKLNLIFSKLPWLSYLGGLQAISSGKMLHVFLRTNVDGSKAGIEEEDQAPPSGDNLGGPIRPFLLLFLPNNLLTLVTGKQQQQKNNSITVNA